MRVLLLLIPLACCALPARSVSGQGAPIATSRPSFSTGSGTVAPGTVQVEGGYTYSDGNGARQHVLGELFLRYGLGPGLEARLSAGSYVWSDRRGRTRSGFSDPAVGVKVRLVEPAPSPGLSRPGAALSLGTTLPLGEEPIGDSRAQPSARLSLDWSLSERTGLAVNARYAFLNSEENADEFAASALLGRSLWGTGSLYVEGYGLFRPGLLDEGYAEAGFLYRLSSDAQLDARLGAGLTDASADFYVGVGAAWRR
ncbi:MAG: transporter [Rhodothermales bacterium]|nr:transporter [Rhodothermales bacterium]